MSEGKKIMFILMPVIFLLAGLGAIIYGIFAIKSERDDFINSKTFEGEVIGLKDGEFDTEYNQMTYSPVVRYYDGDKKIEFDLKSNYYENSIKLGQKIKLRLFLKNHKEGDMPVRDPVQHSWIGFAGLFLIGAVFAAVGFIWLKIVI